jgi:hypothetical protein
MFAFWPRNLYFAHNHISQTGGLGLNIGWNARSETSVFQGCVLEHNRIHDVAMWTNDSGGIHTKSNSSGLRIYQNWRAAISQVSTWMTAPKTTRSTRMSSKITSTSRSRWVSRHNASR